MLARHRDDRFYLYDAACAYAVAAELSAAERPQRSQAFKDRAMELLVEAVERGYYVHIRDEDDFAARCAGARSATLAPTCARPTA